jgi:UDP-glucose 4-epimerase
MFAYSEKLSWQPKHADLTTIIEDAWAWEQKFPWK